MAVQQVLEITVNGKRYPSLEQGLSGISREIGTLPEEMSRVYKRELRKFLNQIADVMEKRHSGPYTGFKSSAGRLQKRSGVGLASIRKSINVEGDNLGIIGEIGGLKRLAIHEFGGVVTPNARKFLTIPLPAALDSRGVPLKLSPRDWDKTAVIKTAGGRLMIIQKRGRNNRIIPLYILTKRVVIKKRLGMRNAVDRRLSDFADNLANTIVTELTKEMADA